MTLSIDKKAHKIYLLGKGEQAELGKREIRSTANALSKAFLEAAAFSKEELGHTSGSLMRRVVLPGIGEVNAQVFFGETGIRRILAIAPIPQETIHITLGEAPGFSFKHGEELGTNTTAAANSIRRFITGGINLQKPQ